jgi:hypothetical protein
MKGIHWSVWVALVVLVLLVVLFSARKEGYAPPRDENTQPPYTENVGNVATTSNNLPYVDSTSNVVRVDNQSQIYKDMGGLDFQIQAGNPILNFIQGDPSSNVVYGDFVPNESDGGSARMYAYEDREMVAPEENLLPPVPTNSNVFATIQGVDVRGDLFDVHGNKFAGTDVTQRTDANQYIPELTSFAIPFLGDQPGISASESPVLTTSPAVTQ